MNIEVKDFRKDDKEKQIESIYQTLISLASAMQFIPDGQLPIGTVLPFAVTKEMILPTGFEKCDGQNKTPDLRDNFTSLIIYIQKVK